MEVTDIIKRIAEIKDRKNELLGESITLNAKLENNQINHILYHMKFDCIEFEQALLNMELDEIEAEVVVKQLIEESKNLQIKK